MSIKAGTGTSKNSDATEAGREAVDLAIKQIGGKPDLIIIYSSVVYDQEKMLAGANAAAGGAMIVGCSDAGEITEHGVTSNQVAAMAFSSDQMKFVTGLGQGIKGNEHKAGMAAALDVKNKAPEAPKMFIMLSDGLSGNGTSIIRGIQEVLGEHLPIMGGSAGDDFKAQKTYQYYGDKVLNDAVVGIGLCGKFTYAVGVEHGWEPIGLPMKVTKSENNIIKEIDGRPALKIYEEALGKTKEELMKTLVTIAMYYPLGMSVPGSDDVLIRYISATNDQEELIAAAEVPEGSEVRLMLCGAEKALWSSKKAAENALAQLKGSTPKAILIFSCIARLLLLGSRVNEEITPIQEVLGKDVPLLGFYTYGEQAPFKGDINPSVCHTVFHNETMTLMVIGE